MWQAVSHEEINMWINKIKFERMEQSCNKRLVQTITERKTVGVGAVLSCILEEMNKLNQYWILINVKILQENQ